MRQKLVQQRTIDKYISFLNTIKALANHKDRKLKFIVEDNSIDKMIVKAMQELKIIRMEGQDFWEWLKGDVSRQMVLEILDKLLHYKKKTVHVPINKDWATVANTLSTISDRLGVIASQNERSLKTAKNQPEQTNSETLFSEREQYHNDLVKISCSIVSGMYRDVHNASHSPFEFYSNEDVNKMNHRVIFAAKDLLNKINDECAKS